MARRSQVLGSGTAVGVEVRVMASARAVPLRLMLTLRVEAVGSKVDNRPGFAGVNVPTYETSKKFTSCVTIAPLAAVKEPKAGLLIENKLRLVRSTMVGPNSAKKGTTL